MRQLTARVLATLPVATFSIGTASASDPIANAGPDRVAEAGSTVRLDASRSQSAIGNELTYAWSVVSGSATISDAAAVRPAVQLTSEAAVLRLTVTDGDRIAYTDEVRLGAAGLAPVAAPGRTIGAAVGDRVSLSAIDTFHPDGLPVSFAWSVVSVPSGSAPALIGGDTATPSLTVGVEGDTVVELVVTDEAGVASEPSRFVVTTRGAAPVAEAGDDLSVTIGATVRLDADGTVDPDGEELSSEWSILSAPLGSSAALGIDESGRQAFTADVAGDYVVQLAASDGTFEDRDTVLITAGGAVGVAPVASATADGLVGVGQEVSLDGTASYDRDGDALAYAWSVLARPDGSTSEVDAPVLPRATVTTDRSGSYLVQLAVTDADGWTSYETVSLPQDLAAPLLSAGPDGRIVDGQAPLGGATANGTAVSWSHLALGPVADEASFAAPGFASTTVRFRPKADQPPLRRTGSTEALGLLGQYGVITSDSLEADATLHEPTFVGGDLTGGKASFNGRASEGEALVVVGNVLGGRKQVTGGQDVRLGGAGASLVKTTGKGEVIADPTLSAVSIADALVSLSAETAGLVPTGTVTTATGKKGRTESVIEAAAGPNGVAVFDVAEASTLFGPGAPGSVRVEVGDATAVLVNVGGASVDISNVSINGPVNSQADSAKVLWNFHEATSVEIGVPFRGVVLAPNAHVRVDQNMKGALAAASARIDAPIHGPRFDGAQLVGEAMPLAIVQLSADSAEAIDTAVLTTGNVRPVAGLSGPNETRREQTITFDGSASSDANGDGLTYEWSLIEAPEGNEAALSGSSASASLTPDTRGTYVAQLTVRDGELASAPVTHAAQVIGYPPVALATIEGEPRVGEALTLNGTGSTDRDGDALSYDWRIVERPEGSLADIFMAGMPTASFAPDVAGPYTALLTVTDIEGFSDTAMVAFEAVKVNEPPVLAAIAPKSVQLGSELSFDLLATDPDGDLLSFAVSPLPLPEGASFDAATGTFAFRPVLQSQVGTVALQFLVSDGELTDTQSVSIEVTKSADGATSYAARVADADQPSKPIVGATVRLGDDTATTGSDGTFFLVTEAEGLQTVLVTPPSAAQSSDGLPYASVRFAVDLVPGGANEPGRDVLLPTLSGPSVEVVSGEATILNDPSRGIAVEVPADSVLDAAGRAYAGPLALVPVSPEQANQLPPGVLPCDLFSLEPGHVVFSVPVTVTLPNADRLPAGTSTNVWVFEGNAFALAGTGVVSNDGDVVTAQVTGLTGGALLTTAPAAPGVNIADDQPTDSWRPNLLADGVVTARVGTLPYRSLETDRQLALRYDSAAAEGQARVATDVTMRDVAPERLRSELFVGGQRVGEPTYVSLTKPAPVGSGETIRVASGAPVPSLATGVYAYEHRMTASYACSTVTASSRSRVIVRSDADSAIGRGWTVEGLQRVRQQADGSIVHEDGYGRTSVFELGGTGVESGGAVGEIGPLPPSLLEGQREDDQAIQVFLESVSRELTSSTPFDEYQITGGGRSDRVAASSLPAGAVVTSYIVRFDPRSSGIDRVVDGTVVFPRDVVAIELTTEGLRSGDRTLGGSTIYSRAADRGLEEGVDALSLASDLRTLSLTLSEADGIDEVRVITIGRQREVIASRFEDGADSWVPWGPNRGGLHEASGGNPGGLFRVNDRLSSRGTSRFANEEKFVGDLTSFINGWFTYEIKVTPVDAGVGNGDFAFISDIGTLVYQASYPPTQDFWTHYAALMNPNAPGWYYYAPGTSYGSYYENPEQRGSVPTEAQFRSVLADVKRLEVRSEFRSGLDVGRLDNVVLFAPEPSTDSIAALSPSGDFSELIRNPDGTFTRRMRDGTVFAFDAEGLMTQAKDRNGNVEGYAYDAEGRLTAITDPTGKTVRLSYGAGGTLESITHPGGETTAIVSDRQKFIATDPDGSKREYIKDVNGRLTQRISARGLVTTHSYGPGGAYAGSTLADGSSVRLAAARAAGLGEFGLGTPENPIPNAKPNGVSELTDPNGNVTTMRFNSFGSPIEITDPLGRVTRMTRDEDDLVTELRTPLPDGGERVDLFEYGPFDGLMLSHTEAAGTEQERVTAFTYDDIYAQVTSTTDAGGFVTTMQIGTSGDLLSSTDPTGAVTGYEYDTRGLRTAMLDPLGNRTAFRFGDDFNLTGMTSPVGDVVAYENDESGRVTSVTEGVGTPEERQTAYTYDEVGRVLTETDGEGGVTTYAYDANGNLVSQADPTGVTVTYAYDEVDRLIETDDPAIGKTTYAYDFNGNMTSVTDAAGEVTTYEYDEADRMVRSVDALGGVRTFAYDERDNLVLVSDANGNETTFAFDALDRPVSRTNALGETWAFAYDARDNHVRATKPDGQVIVSEYDDRSDLLAMTGAGLDQRYDYDAVGNLLSATASGIERAFEYDAANRPVTSVTRGLFGQGAENAALTYAYDALGRRESMTDGFGGATAYAYDRRDALTELTAPSSNTYAMTHDAAGRTTERTAPGVASAMAYDGGGRLTDLTHGAFDDFVYGFDVRGDLVSFQERGRRVRGYDHDALQRLTEVRTNGAVSESYQLDPEGNREASHLSAGHVTGAANRLLSTDRWTYGYDRNGNRTSKVAKDGSETWAYEYDVLDRLIAVRKDGALVDAYAYDALGDRSVITAADGSATGIVHDGPDRILDLVASAASEGGALVRRYAHGGGIDKPFEVEAFVEGGGSRLATYTYHADHLGSVRRLSDGQGAAVGSYDYDSYGGLLSADAPSVLGLRGQPFGYTGRERDVATDLYHYRARAYDPETGTFLQEDPIGFAAGDLNLSRYVGSSPLRYVDPTGLTSSERAAVGGVAGALAAGGRVSSTALNTGGSRLAGELASKNLGSLARTGGTLACRFFEVAASLEAAMSGGTVIPGGCGAIATNDNSSSDTNSGSAAGTGSVSASGSSGGGCTPEELNRLQSRKNRACNQPRKCFGRNGALDLTSAERQSRVDAGRRCEAARSRIMNQCFKGGDKPHQRELQRVRDTLNMCLGSF